MNAQMSRKLANFHVTTIGLFHILSGLWEFMLGAAGEEGIKFGNSVFTHIYGDYLMITGLVTIILGILLLFKINLVRIAVIVLAKWNLIISPVAWVTWHIYTKALSENLLFEWVIYTIILILIMLTIRLYIIYILKISKAGYIFLKDKN